jgi:signal transduction histidine kinase
MRRVATKILLTFAVALVAFGAVAAFGIARLDELRRDLRLLSGGYLALTRIAAGLDVKDWVAARALEARGLDRAARQAYLPVARAQFPAFVREKIEEGRRVAREARMLAAREGEARFFDQVSSRLDALGAHWSEYDAKARALFDAIEAGEGQNPRTAAAFEDRAQEVRQLEKGLSIEVKLLQAALESQISERVHAAERAESRTVLLIVVYSLIAFAIGIGAAVIAQRLLAPIEKLTEGVKAVAAGDLTRKVEVRSADEIGLLAREFNTMAASLARQRDELRRAERLATVGRISAQITHEIRNPLNAIGLNADLLADELAEAAAPTEARQLVDAISSEVDRLNAVAEEYLSFARLPRPSLARQDVNDILASLLDFLAPELTAARVEVRRELEPSLPAVRADEAQLRAVFLNLLRNSREAMPRGGTVTVRTRRRGAEVETEVDDTGGGIPEGDLTRIFEPFYSTKERGTGLGLALAQQVVQEHAGTIRCESAVGRGTTFTIGIPIAPAEPDATRDGGTGVPPPGEGSPERKAAGVVR